MLVQPKQPKRRRDATASDAPLQRGTPGRRPLTRLPAPGQPNTARAHRPSDTRAAIDRPVGTPDWEAAAVWGQLDRFPEQPAIPETRASDGMDALFDQARDEAAEASEQARLGDDPVTLDISWSGVFGGDLSADVIARGAIDPDTASTTSRKRNGTRMLDARYVADPDADAGGRDQRLQMSMQLPRRGWYKLIIEPPITEPAGRYRRTTRTVNVDADAERASVDIQLNVNRWNLNNVDDVWEQRGIDRELAADTVSVPLCRRRVRVNRLVVPRVQQTDAAFRQLPRATQNEIVDSIAIMGGYARRTTSAGTFSNHSIGCAIDINYNKATRQNHHFSTHKEKNHLRWVEKVINTDPRFVNFNFFQERNQEQLAGANAFSGRFPGYLSELVASGAHPDVGKPTHRQRLADLRQRLATLTNTPAAQVMATITRQDLDSAIAAIGNREHKAALRQVRGYWAFTRAWLVGAAVRDNVDKRNETLYGMVPLHKALLQIFLDAGWHWGGNWTESKDYMHFEDREAMQQVTNQGGV